jgi:DNA-binding CsgD family transcriptional regulator
VAPRLIVVEGPPGAADGTVTELRADGWHVAAGFSVDGGSGSRAVRHGRVETAADASAALLAALAGHGLVVEGPPSTILDTLVDDLRRLGPVDHRVAAPAADPGPPGPAIDPQALALLAALAGGLSLGEAAAALGVSRRTADRRLADARQALGAERTTEAIARARRAGWLGAPRPDDPMGG